MNSVKHFYEINTELRLWYTKVKSRDYQGNKVSLITEISAQHPLYKDEDIVQCKCIKINDLQQAMIFTNFDRHALYDVKEASKISGKPLQYFRKGTDVPAGGRSLLLGTNFDLTDLTPLGNSQRADTNYSDQIPFKCGVIRVI